MARATVLWPFFVRRGGRIYEVGEAFEGTEEKVAQLVARGLAEPLAADSAAPGGEVGQVPDAGGSGPDSAPPAPVRGLSGMTNPQLAALCRERGIKAPSKATKAQLLSLLGE